jgi:signal recognition particle GTPase
MLVGYIKGYFLLVWHGILIQTSLKMVQVGSALSMVYISGAPVMFVGCGQSYTDLKKLNVKSIVKTLLK